MFADGLFLIDIDKFLRPTGPESVPAVVQLWLADDTVGAVALNWAVYGSSGNARREPGLVLERLTRRAHRILRSIAIQKRSCAWRIAPGLLKIHTQCAIRRRSLPTIRASSAMPNDVESFGPRGRHKVSRNRIEDAFRDIAPIEPLRPGLVADAQTRFAEIVGRINAVQFMDGFGVSACRLVNKLARPLSTRTKRPNIRFNGPL